MNPYFTPDARESLKSLQGVLLEKATESATEAVENPGHHRRPTRGSEDADDRQQGLNVSPDDLIVRFFFCISSFTVSLSMRKLIRQLVSLLLTLLLLCQSNILIAHF